MPTGVSLSQEAARAFDSLGIRYEQAYGDLPQRREMVERLIGLLPPSGRVLDLGCGTGRPAAEMLAAAGMRVTGIDVSGTMIELARAQVPKAEFVQADVLTYVTDDASWDGICAFFSLLNMTRAELNATFAALARWLRPGGHLAISTVPLDAEGVVVDLLGERFRVTSYSAGEFIQQLTSAGLHVLTSETTQYVPDSDSKGRSEEHLYCLARRPAET
ncbi:class I SAM-dependent methyltransferase [Bailinhaonella thermotolerans]|uniref:Class I SAM-dependent methyltransferase n=2 Tax=Bailinhaonella thermotolerans TaxID=1070861 RepID=A0A3A3ZZK6_9ACTN|nr:class I SAM-dependent methyltransferase [Bailinhaonella thermotolerans]